MSRKNKEMSNETETQEAPKAKRTIVRGPQKVFAVVTLTDPQGNEVDLRKDKNKPGFAKSGYQLSILLSKDQKGVLDLVMDGSQAYVEQLEVPKANAADEDEAETTDA